MQYLKKGSKKLLNAWAFYDWANSVYSLVIASAVFPIYYQALFSSAGINSITIFGGEIRSTPLITYTTAAAFVIISLLVPILSGIADFVGNKKVFIDKTWANPYEQTWMSNVYQLQKEGKITAGVLLASPIWHERIQHYKKEDRREN